MAELVAKNICGEDVVRRFEAASTHMSDRQRALLNLTENDVYAIAPGVLGSFLSFSSVAACIEPARSEETMRRIRSFR